jgi:hypothetical protein
MYGHRGANSIASNVWRELFWVMAVRCWLPLLPIPALTSTRTCSTRMLRPLFVMSGVQLYALRIRHIRTTSQKCRCHTEHVVRMTRIVKR